MFRTLEAQMPITKTNQGSVVVVLRAQRDQGSGLLQGRVVQGIFLCLDPWGNHGRLPEDQLYLPQTFDLTEYL